MELVLYGETNDLLYVNEEGTIKSTRVCMVDADTDIEKDEIVDITLTSSSTSGEHPLFDEFIGKEIRIKVETIE